jgi:DNA-binding beta-propeller fold protein YncE
MANPVQRWTTLVQIALSVLVLLMAFVPAARASSVGAEPSPYAVVLADLPIDAAILYPPVYDGLNGNLYVTGYNGVLTNGTLTAISGATNRIVATANAGWEPLPATVDSANGDLYVPNFTPGCTNCPPGFWQAPPNVTVVSSTTSLPVASIITQPNPTSVAFDPANGELYVACDGKVSVISGSNNTVLTTIASGSSADQAVYDGTNGDIYVWNSNTSALTVIRGSSNSVIGSIPVGEQNGPILFDETNGDLYVAYDDGTAIVSGSTNTVVRDLPGSMGEPTFVDSQGDVYFLQAGFPGNVTVLSGTSNSVLSTFSVGAASWMAYNPSTGNIYSVYRGSNIVNITSSQSHELVQKLGLGIYGTGGDGAPVYDPGNGDLYVALFESSRIAVIGNGTPSSPASSLLSPFLWGLGAGALVGVLVGAMIIVFVGRRRRHRAAGDESSAPDAHTADLFPLLIHRDKRYIDPLKNQPREGIEPSTCSLPRSRSTD